jgi:ornithine carbamoyltransferase
VFGQYVDAVVLRVFHHATIVEFAAHAPVPVVNGLSDLNHPCQALGDLLTIQEECGAIAGRTVVFVGDGNNVARSLAVGCGKLGARFVLSAPPGYGFDDAFLARYRAQVPEGELAQIASPTEAVRVADIVYTDVWTSMGRAFAGYQVNAALLGHAPPHARVLHCLPAHRGEEIADEAMDGPQSSVFPQAGNRMHAQKALLAWLLAPPTGGNNTSRQQPRTTGRKPRAR